ncbi:PREDICTED: indoleacetaldoxime dehydratase-like [Camelina sativa]|uniref:Indoleacetaldoxime dehydratase-like n=1 Tax=Camelina sativa TaxID=90675 RepID=A0ABM0T6Y1_CAMSA|nr:PREDICTED: indoleacetaldoxime dehydratase-like [Camelina sativa]
MILLISMCLTTLFAFLFLNPILIMIRANKTNLNPPPSPWRFPVIGNLHQLSLNPHRSLCSLSLHYGPLMLLHFGRVPILVVSSADYAHEVMKTHDIIFSNRPKSRVAEKLFNGGRDLALAPYGEYWRQFKSICVMNLLSNKTVRSFGNIREEEINVMIGILEKASSSSSPVNLSEILMTLTNDVMTRVVLGRKYSSEEGGKNSKNIVRRLMELMGAFPIGEYIPSLAWIDKIRGFDKKVETVKNEIRSFLEKVVEEHVDADENISDFTDMLLSIQKDKSTPIKLDRTALKNLLLDMLFGGASTTFTLIEWTMTELMRHPQCMKKLQDEIRSVSKSILYVSEKEVVHMNYLNVVIKEVLRLHPSGPLIPRLLSEDVKLNGYDIAAGTQVLINVWAIQRDIATWGSDAEEFRPERHFDSFVDFQGQNFKYFPFGSGRRQCPGIGFALALAELTIANLVNRFDWRVKIGPLGDKPDLVEANGIDVCRKFPLIIYPDSNLFSM